MFEQAGIWKILLYERKDLTFNYPSISNNQAISNITNTGSKYSITLDQEAYIIVRTKVNGNYKVAYEYELNFMLNDYTINNLLFIKELRQSKYGWSPYLYMHNADEKFINSALYFVDSEINNNISNSFKVKMTTKIPTTNRILDIEAEQGFLQISESEFLAINASGELLAYN